MKRATRTLSLTVVAAALTGCGGMMMSSPSMMAPPVPAAVTVPAGNKVAMVLVGEGLLTYECRATAAGAPTPFGGSPPAPDAHLKEKGGAIVGKYYPGPTWEHNDGSKITGKQLAVSPATTGIAMQLVQANPATGSGMMNGVTYIQRVNTMGGTPAGACDMTNVGAKQVVKYSADYYFYKAA
ncbi:MAG: DUF3455 domain-containing protein [Betaproteobacteria bacterium]